MSLILYSSLVSMFLKYKMVRRCHASDLPTLHALIVDTCLITFFVDPEVWCCDIVVVCLVPTGGCPQSAMVLGASLCGPIVWSALTLAILDENHKLDGVDSASELWLEIHLSKFDPTFVLHGYEQLEVEGFSSLDRWMRLGGFAVVFDRAGKLLELKICLEQKMSRDRSSGYYLFKEANGAA